jgi:hypothetical protein
LPGDDWSPPDLVDVTLQGTETAVYDPEYYIGTGMEIHVPHQITYETRADVPVSEVADSLLGAERLLLEIGPFLEEIIPGLVVDSIRVSVKEISQGSLKEVLWAAIFIAFQHDLEKEVPPLINDIFGADIPHRYDTLVTVLFCLLLFYGADQIYQRVTRLSEGRRIKAQLEGLIDEVSRQCHVPKDKIKRTIERRYSKANSLRLLTKATLQIFRPSKSQNNSAMTIGEKQLDPLLIEEIPSDIALTDVNENESTEQIENVEIKLHAQDIDRTKRGWAAVIPGISHNRLRMEIYPPIKPQDIYTKTLIRGDIVLVSRMANNGDMQPYMFHLVRLRE